MQETQVQSLVREDPTCLRAAKPMCHNYWACTLEPVSHNYWAHTLQLLKSTCLEPMLCNKRSHHNGNLHIATKSSPCSPQPEEAQAHKQRPSTAKNYNSPGSLDGREVSGRVDTCICMTESLCCSLETITTLFVNWLYPNTKLKTIF